MAHAARTTKRLERDLFRDMKVKGFVCLARPEYPRARKILLALNMEALEAGDAGSSIDYSREILRLDDWIKLPTGQAVSPMEAETMPALTAVSVILALNERNSSTWTPQEIHLRGIAGAAVNAVLKDAKKTGGSPLANTAQGPGSMTYVKVKPGVDMSGLSPKIWKVAFDIADVFAEFDLDAVITSAFRPKKPNSLHHGFALDFRANHIHRADRKQVILERIKAATGPDYDVILHGAGANIHYHIEYDPK